MAQSAMFGGLVVDEAGNLAEVSHVGQNACYVVFDDDFKRHIDAEEVDRQVLQFMRGQVDENRDMAVSTMLEMMGKDDIFTKAAVESSINNMEDAVGQPHSRAGAPMAGHARLPHCHRLSRQRHRH